MDMHFLKEVTKSLSTEIKFILDLHYLKPVQIFTLSLCVYVCVLCVFYHLAA